LTQGNYPISPPSPTNQYEFEVEVGNGRRVFVHFVIVQHTRTYQNLNQQIGGLRIKTITTHPVIGDAIVKNYAYENVNAPESSGYIIGRPAYLEDLPLSAGISYGLSSNPSCVAMGYKLNTGSIFPLTSVQGSHIGYSRVVERVSTDQGHTETRFYTDPIHNPKYLVTFPARPEVFADPRVGNMIEESHYNNSGQLIAQTTNNYGKQGFPALNSSSYAGAGFPQCNYDYNFSLINYVIPCEFTYLTNMTSLKDGVTTTSSMEYGLLADTLTMMTAQDVTNSDGKVHRTEYSYTNSYNINLDIKNALLTQNRLLPAWQMIKKVDGNIVDGTRLLYAYRASDGTMLDPEAAGSGGVYTARQDRREVTWNGGSRIDNGWQPNVSFKRYFIPMGKPDLLNVDGWPIDHSFQYSLTGKLLNYTYNGFTSSYSYHSNTDELTTKTNVDGTYQTFDYDGLLRLKTTTKQPKGVVTRFEYQYSQPSLITNSIKQAMLYPITAGSGLDSVVHITHSDGLGRELQRIHKYGAPNYDDVLIRTTYDAVGRPIQQYTPQAVAGNHGSYVSTTPTTAAAVTSYYADPLSRAETITPPAWYPSSTVYGNNTTPLTSPDGIVYPVASLYKTMSIDADGKKTIIYTDKVGRVVCQVKASANEAESAATWTIYDDKNRPTLIVPPGPTMSTPNLLFENRYDTEDNLIYKKVPDATAEQYVYNERNLLIGMRNGILTSQGRWLVTHYDAFGRQTKRGYHNLSGTLPSTDNPVINTLLEENFYDGYNGTSTITSPIYKNKLRKQRTKVLEDNVVNNQWIESELTYDAYGRVISTTGNNHRGQSETTSTSYDFADNVITTTQTITGPQGITQQMAYTYDHQGRKIDESISINGGTPKTLSNCVYNHRNEIIERNIGKTGVAGPTAYLQSVDYTYNVQGWLTGINELFSGILPMGPDPCGGGGESSRFISENMSPTNLDQMDIFSQKLNYDINNAGMTNHKNGNISSIMWWHKGRYNQTYGYNYDFLDRVKVAAHGDYQNYPNSPNRYDESFDYDLRGNITKLNRKGVIHDPYLNPQCYKVSTIDSLTYSYMPSTNKLATIVDKAPCEDVLYLPENIDRDISYAANQLIIADHTTVNCLADLNLRVGQELIIRDSLKIPTSCSTAPTVYVDKGPCPDIKYSPGFSQQSTDPYQYDGSGNLTYDPHKKLTILYNHMNLPYKVIGNELDTLTNLYSSSGRLLQRKYSKQGIQLLKTDYIANLEYHLDTLKLLHHSDGRIIFNTAGIVYEYKINDHLGNTRVTFADDNNDHMISLAERRSKNDYYSFGLEHYNANQESEYRSPENRYLYNSKEMISEMNWDILDFGQRMADPATGRFTTIDPLSSYYYHLTCYGYTANNPIKYIDYKGAEIINPYSEGTEQFIKLTKILYILSKSNSNTYNLLNDSKIKVTFYLEDPSDEKVQRHGRTYTSSEFKISKNKLKVKPSGKENLLGGIYYLQTYSNSNQIGIPLSDELVSPIEAERQFNSSYIGISSIDIRINPNDNDERQYITAGHEAGHAAFNIMNPFLTWVWSIIGDPKKEGHDKNNPNGASADREEKQASKYLKFLSLADWEKIAEEIKNKNK
jgi:RHS repeat-associated protein